MLDTIVAISLAVGLAAACGFRVFVPMLIVSVASRAGYLSLADGFEWISSWPAISAFGVATVLEIGAYYLPWLDNALDAAATPTAVIAGVIVSAAFVHDVHPLMKWSLAVIAGGGSAGVVKTGLAGIRLGASAVTGGLGNAVVSTIEWISAVAMSILAICLPLLAGVLAVVLVAFLLRFAYRMAAGFLCSKGPETTPGAAR